jgi:hypothetical protein
MTPAIWVAGLTRRYRGQLAVDDVSRRAHYHPPRQGLR